MKIGDTVRWGDKNILGRVQDIVPSVQILRMKHPIDYKWLKAVAIEYEKRTIRNWERRFPLILVDMGASRAYYIYKNEVKNFIFEKRIDLISELKKRIADIDYQIYQFMSHRTYYWRDCLRSGVKPLTHTGFHELDKIGRPYSMWIGNFSTDFTNLRFVDGNANDGIIVARKTTKMIPLLKVLEKHNLLNMRFHSLFHKVFDWYITFETVYRKDIVAVYSPLSGGRLA